MLHDYDLINFDNEDKVALNSDSTSVWSESSRNDGMSEHSTTELSTLDEINSLFDPLKLKSKEDDVNSEDELRTIFDPKLINIDQIISEFNHRQTNSDVLEKARKLLNDDFITLEIYDNHVVPTREDRIAPSMHDVAETFDSFVEIDFAEVPKRNESQDSRFTTRTNDTVNTTETVVYFEEYRQTNQPREDRELIPHDEVEEMPPITLRLWRLWMRANQRNPEFIDRGIGVISMLREFENQLLSQITEAESCSSHSDDSSTISAASSPPKSSMAWEIPLDETNHHLSLQEAFELHRMAFVRRSRRRQQVIKAIASKQASDSPKVDFPKSQKRDQSKVDELITFHPVNSARRKMTQAEIRDQNDKIYKRLPEVVERKETQRRQEYYNSNRLKAQTYNHKILSKLLARANKGGHYVGIKCERLMT